MSSPFRPLFVDAEQAIRSKKPDSGYDRFAARLDGWMRRYAAEVDPWRRSMLKIEYKLMTMSR